MTWLGRRDIAAWVERAMLIIGAACVATPWMVARDAARVQAAAAVALERPGGAGGHDHAMTPKVSQGTVVGRLEIPRIGLSVMVLEGDDEATLRVAAGHLPDTPLPWHAGNSAIAGHRDTFFRPLQHVRAGDRVRLNTTHGDFEYVVTDTRIVEPTTVSVLAPTRVPSLTLVTCYPFRWIGSAPQRFIVRAERVEAEASNTR